ncbi:Mbov_0400 family ICE element protein [Mycoplasmopsis adleri]|uniref:Mbov_0400 family ICE element protein n=1 Tax=Mycoplasmopsis adleri TaxID=51362 RepID=UPI00387348F4
MSLDLWKPLKIINPLLEDIFNLPIDGKVLSNKKIQVHPLIIFENKSDKTYYCIRLQTANKSTIKNDILINDKTYQTNDYWKTHQGVAVTKDIFIIDKELLENNIYQDIYESTIELNDSDKNLIIQDLDKRINSIPPNLNILKISNNLEHNLVLYTNDNLIANQIFSTLSNNRIKQSTKNYYAYHFNKEKFLNDTNELNKEHTQEALKDIKLCIDKEQNIANEYFFQYELDKDSGNYFILNQEENTNSNEESEEETKGRSR